MAKYKTVITKTQYVFLLLLMEITCHSNIC